MLQHITCFFFCVCYDLWIEKCPAKVSESTLIIVGNTECENEAGKKNHDCEVLTLFMLLFFVIFVYSMVNFTDYIS